MGKKVGLTYILLLNSYQKGGIVKVIYHHIQTQKKNICSTLDNSHPFHTSKYNNIQKWMANIIIIMYIPI